jgi:hypothetical protein
MSMGLLLTLWCCQSKINKFLHFIFRLTYLVPIFFGPSLLVNTKKEARKSCFKISNKMLLLLAPLSAPTSSLWKLVWHKILKSIYHLTLCWIFLVFGEIDLGFLENVILEFSTPFAMGLVVKWPPMYQQVC